MLEKLHILFSGLPVVMYHPISKEKNALSIHPHLFEDHCRALQKAGWKTIGLAEAEAYFLAGEKLPKKAVWLTFDDAYLDNFIYAYPILRKYGLQGTVFSVLQLIDKGQVLRPTIEDVWRGDLPEAELPAVNQPFVQNSLGFKKRKTLFLNWEEIRFLQKSGVLDFAPHSLRHDRVFVAPEHKGFFQPADRVRTFDRVQGEIPWGLPKFKNNASLGSRAYLPSPELLAGVKNLVPQTKEAACRFFQDDSSVAKLQSFVESFEPNKLGRLESDTEMQTRFEQEMHECQTIMQKELGACSRTFSWPWGAYNLHSLAAAQKAGFELFVSTASGANWPARKLKCLAQSQRKPLGNEANLSQPADKCPEIITATACRFNIKQRNSKELMRRLKLLSCNLIAAFYSLIRFRGKL